MTRVTHVAFAVALAAALAPGASAQSAGSFSGSGFLVNVAEANTLASGVYTYTYTLTLDPSSASGAYVNGLSLGSPGGALDPLNTPTITGAFTSGTPDAVTTDGKAADFTDVTGLTPGNSAIITLTSGLGPQLGVLLIGGAGSGPGLSPAVLTGPGTAPGFLTPATVSTVQSEVANPGGGYTDTLTATLLSGGFVNAFLFTSPAGNISPLNTPTASGAGFNAQPDGVQPAVTDFSALGGLTPTSPTATFRFQSSAPLGALGVTAAGSGPVTVRAAAVPEADPALLSFAGLALLGLTLTARRRAPRSHSL